MTSATLNHSFFQYQDKDTGAFVTRLTDASYLCTHPYFYNQIFSPDGKLLLHSALIEGVRGLYVMDLQRQCSTALVQEEGLHPSSAQFSKDGIHVYYLQHNTFFKMNIETKVTQAIYTTPDGWVASDTPSFSQDETKFVTIELCQADCLPFRKDWSLFEAQWAKKPLCRIVMFDQTTQMATVLHQENTWLGHPQFCPSDDRFLSFCHEGPSHCIDARLWGCYEHEVFCLRPQRDCEMITHEFWLQDGSKMGYVHRTQDNNGKTLSQVVDPKTFAPKAEHGSMRQQMMWLNPKTRIEETGLTSSCYCHCIANHSGTFLVGDGQLAGEDFIYLLSLETGAEEALCGHHTSWNPYQTNQDSHPHPCFSPDGKQILFVSDQHGLPALYLVHCDKPSF